MSDHGTANWTHTDTILEGPNPSSARRTHHLPVNLELMRVSSLRGTDKRHRISLEMEDPPSISPLIRNLCALIHISSRCGREQIPRISHTFSAFPFYDLRLSARGPGIDGVDVIWRRGRHTARMVRNGFAVAERVPLRVVQLQKAGAGGGQCMQSRCMSYTTLPRGGKKRGELRKAVGDPSRPRLIQQPPSDTRQTSKITTEVSLIFLLICQVQLIDYLSVHANTTNHRFHALRCRRRPRIALLALSPESISSVDCAWEVYNETYSVERTAALMSAMEVAAEARGAELMGEDWGRVRGLFTFLSFCSSCRRDILARSYISARLKIKMQENGGFERGWNVREGT
ncbi:hypothetical protein B0H19DRAFT_1072773 [Mycena capillaripes]|nr:hypothetical protein B0H19DRAFT_1072773 [Mycena capillaripes]